MTSGTFSTFMLLNSFPLNPIQLKNKIFFFKGIIIDPPQKLFCTYNSYFFPNIKIYFKFETALIDIKGH